MSRKRIILMYISEISGHHSATLAIERALREVTGNDIELMNINAFNYTNPISEKIINRLYMAIIKKTPRLWNYLYDNPKIIKKISGIKKAIHKFNSPKLKELFDKFKPDAVACTQAFPCGMVADFKEESGCAVPLVAVLTDYVPHSYWIYDKINYYITPSVEVTRRLTEKGVEDKKIISLGIPFDHKFNARLSRMDAAGRLGFDPDIFTILIMGGGQGLGPIKTIVASLEKLDRDLQEIVVTGSNKKLYRSLTKEAKKYRKKIAVFGYADNVNELMDASDIVITKPGGITTAEALAKSIPMIIVRPIPGQEANNTAYLAEKKAALKLDEPEKINLLIEELIADPGKLKDLREAAGRISKPQASMDIAKLLLNLSNHKNV